MISFRMLKLFEELISKSLEHIFRYFIDSEKFEPDFKKANVAPFHQSGEKKVLSNIITTYLR